MTFARALSTALGGVALLAAGPAMAGEPQDRPKEVSIPFANHNGIRDFHVADGDTIYLEGINRQWYKAELMGYCPDLRFSHTLGFETGPIGSFDRFSAIRTRDGRCSVQSLTLAKSPLEKDKKANG